MCRHREVEPQENMGKTHIIVNSQTIKNQIIYESIQCFFQFKIQAHFTLLSLLTLRDVKY